MFFPGWSPRVWNVFPLGLNTTDLEIVHFFVCLQTITEMTYIYSFYIVLDNIWYYRYVFSVKNHCLRLPCTQCSWGDDDGNLHFASQVWSVVGSFGWFNHTKHPQGLMLKSTQLWRVKASLIVMLTLWWTNSLLLKMAHWNSGFSH